MSEQVSKGELTFDVLGDITCLPAPTGFGGTQTEPSAYSPSREDMYVVDSLRELATLARRASIGSPDQAAAFLSAQADSLKKTGNWTPVSMSVSQLDTAPTTPIERR